MSGDGCGKQTTAKQVVYVGHPTNCIQQPDYTSEYSPKEPGAIQGLNIWLAGTSYTWQPESHLVFPLYISS